MSEITIAGEIEDIAHIDFFERNIETNLPATGVFVGRPYYLHYTHAHILVSDAWKHKAKGIPQGSFLLAYYDNEPRVLEALLLRVLGPASLPTDSDITKSMIEYYKDDLKTSGRSSQLDTFTRYEFGFSGIECRILGAFYKNKKGVTCFGADVENFYSAHHYSIVKPNKSVLEAIVNFREGKVAGGSTDIKLGKIRYSSSRRFQEQEDDVPVYVRADDFLGKRTALFGMTRTGKSNSVKKIIQATVTLSNRSPYKLSTRKEEIEDVLEPLTKDNLPKYPVGQIIFDINGEYANPNLQDEGTAIFELYENMTERYSVIPKPNFKVMKVNFYNDLLSGFELVKSYLAEDNADYVKSFLSIDLNKPDNYDPNSSAGTRYDRKVAAYQCCLYKAGLEVPSGYKVTFKGNAELNKMVKDDGSLDPSKKVSLEEASNWFTAIWDNYTDDFFTSYKNKKGYEWADEDLKSLLVFLSRKSKPGGSANNSGYIKLRGIKDLHTSTIGKSFKTEIIDELRAGKIVIVDLSQGNPKIQKLYSEDICEQIFADSMNQFVQNEPNNFIQFYFEEAHNLFPKKDDKDLSQIYNRIAKEGAKLNMGLIYATQEVSSISSNILKNTQNWFIAHLNNEDETKEIKKYYDFGDFVDSLVRFSASSDRGFVHLEC